MKAIIYGNGPSLLTAPRREPGVIAYGVNRSYEVEKAYHWCTADARAFSNRLEWGKNQGFIDTSELHVRPHVFRHVIGEPIIIDEPLRIWSKGPAGQSGAFAMYVTAMHGYDTVYLAGFCDSNGQRFYEEKKEPERPRAEEYYVRETLKQIWEYPKINWKLWRDTPKPGWYDAHEELSKQITSYKAEKHEWERTRLQCKPDCLCKGKTQWCDDCNCWPEVR